MLKDKLIFFCFRIMSGALEEFRIDPLSGEIFTIKVNYYFLLKAKLFYNWG